MWSRLGGPPAAAVLELVHSLDEEGKKFTLEDLRRDCTALLVPPVESEDHQDEIVAEIYE